MPFIRYLPAALATALTLALAAPAALAQTEPFRVVNRSAVPAVALHAMPSGQESWGANLLNRGPLAPGAFLSLRPPERVGCFFDLRLVLQSGQEVVRRETDICAERVVDMVLGPTAAPLPAAPLPQVGGGDQLVPEIRRAPR